MKSHFPIFGRQKELVYLDSAATSLKPESVLSAEREYEESYSANIGRGLYPLAERATLAFETSRKKVATFIKASPDEIIFTSGTTGSINLAAQLLSSSIKTGVNIVVTELEHHSNFLPWKELTRAKHVELRIAPFTSEGLIDMKAFEKLVDVHTAIVAFSAISNVFGGINPVADIVRTAKEKNPKAFTLVDAAQAVGHIPIDVREWDADFIAFSGHKAYGPTGIGVLYGKKEILEQLPPVTFGGGMVVDVYPTPPLAGRACASIYREIPYRFEAGTPNISGAIGLGAAIDFMSDIGLEKIREHDIRITTTVRKQLEDAFGKSIHILGPNDETRRSALISFTLDGIHPHDLAELLGEKNICIRAGEHCASPLHRALDLPATARVSFGIYTTEEDIDRLTEGMKDILYLFKNTEQKTQKPNKAQS